MPKDVINYKNTIIYKIVCNDLNIKDIYVGSTTNFIGRKRQHKKNCCNNIKKTENCKIYKFIKENGGWNNWSMFEIEKFECNDGNEARTRERYWYEILNANLNSQRPLTTIEERTKHENEC